MDDINTALLEAHEADREDAHENASEAFHAIEAVTADDVLEVANEVLDPDRLSALVYFPPKG